MSMRTIALDFDGVIHPYSAGWCGAIPVDEPPTEGALEFAKEAYNDGWRLVVFSTRAADATGLRGIDEYLDKYGFTAYVDLVTSEKPGAIAYVDDRGITFKGDWVQVYRDAQRLYERGPWKAVAPGALAAQLLPAPDEAVWLGTQDRSVHRLNGELKIPLGHGGVGVRMDRYDLLNPETTTLCPSCW